MFRPYLCSCLPCSSFEARLRRRRGLAVAPKRSPDTAEDTLRKQLLNSLTALAWMLGMAMAAMARSHCLSIESSVQSISTWSLNPKIRVCCSRRIFERNLTNEPLAQW